MQTELDTEDEKRARERIAGSVEVLDRVKPNWFLIVDPDTVVMWDAELCVAGQAFADEAAKSEGRFANGYDYALSADVAGYGHGSDGFVEWVGSSIRDAWIELIGERRAAAAVQDDGA